MLATVNVKTEGQIEILGRCTKFWYGWSLLSPAQEHISVPFMHGLVSWPHTMEGQVTTVWFNDSLSQSCPRLPVYSSDTVVSCVHAVSAAASQSSCEGGVCKRV